MCRLKYTLSLILSVSSEYVMFPILEIVKKVCVYGGGFKSVVKPGVPGLVWDMAGFIPLWAGLQKQ